MRKFRFGGADRHEALALSEAYSVFGTPGGRITVLDATGRQMWSRSVFAELAGLELLGSALAVYGAAGACAVVGPGGDNVHELHPPPGLVRLRAPLGQDPIAIHAAGAAVTAFRGYRRKLHVVWRHKCADRVSALDAAWTGRVAVAVAGRRIYRLEGPGA